MTDSDNDARFQSILLEEIRHLLVENLLVQSRIYDCLRAAHGIPDETPTYSTSEEIMDKSFKTVASASNRLFPK